MRKKDIKKVQKLKRELKELEDLAYKRDGMYSHNERFNTRYFSKANELKLLTKTP
ncbi:MAG: hypothetical protein V4538_15680 [Bacteroidota bacterium]